MSSLVRRLQIRAMKRQGYERTKFALVKDSGGAPQLRPVTKGGLIMSPAGDFIGRTWPSRLRASVD